MTRGLALIGTQILMLSCSVTLICVTVRVAWVASVLRDSPRTLALDWKLESHSAVSCWARGGISACGAAGSNVWLAKTTGCLVMVSLGASAVWRGEENFLTASQPKTRTSNN